MTNHQKSHNVAMTVVAVATFFGMMIYHATHLIDGALLAFGAIGFVTTYLLPEIR